MSNIADRSSHSGRETLPTDALHRKVNMVRNKAYVQWTGKNRLRVVACGNLLGMEIECPRRSLRCIPPLLIPDVGHAIIYGSAGLDELHLARGKAVLDNSVNWHWTTGEVPTDVLLGQYRHSCIAKVNWVFLTGVKNLP